MKRLFFPAVCLLLANILPANAAPLAITIQTPPPAESGYFKLGTAKNPDGHEISVDSRSLLLDGKRILPVMGEFHYSRVPESEWRGELLKMKAGGIDIVSTYVFWIHHEEVEGQWDWSGRKDLHKFIETCREVGLLCVVRCGPWCHGEVRNGGLPDWIVQDRNMRPRTTDPNFLAQVKILYGQIAAQLKGELWKDGGPVIGIQVDNEFSGAAAYLLALKQMAIDAGIDVPLYTRTGWNSPRTPLPLGEILPLYGTYGDGFWDRDLKPMEGDKWTHFVFSNLRTDDAIASDILGSRQARDDADAEKYPHLTCEVGGGMMTSYHRRILVNAPDIDSVALTQLGDGGTLLGYYMYHGGQNPDGKLTTLQESQATGYWNDMPEKNYDFQAPIGEYGQINPQYHWMRRLHLFLNDFGSTLAGMPATLPDLRPTNRNDLATLRWDARSDGQGGFVFVNNYQRLQPMPPKKDVQFKLNLPGGEFIFPEKPVTIPAGEFFIWPFNFDLGGAKLVYATAQPICKIDDGNVRTVFFAQTPGVPAEFVFDGSGLAGQTSPRAVFENVRPGRAAAIKLKTKTGGEIQIVLLDEADSLALWKGKLAGSDRVFLTGAGLSIDGDNLKLSSEDPKQLAVEIFPAPEKTAGRPDGIFRRLDLPKAKTVSLKASAEFLQPAGPLRKFSFGSSRPPIVIAPVDADFTNAAVWKIKLPANLDLSLDPILRIHYVGDIAHATLNGKLIDDNFYNGKAFDIGLKRYAPDILNGELRLEILPMQKDAPIYLADEAKPDFGNSGSIARVQGVEIVNRYEVEFTPAAR